MRSKTVHEYRGAFAWRAFGVIVYVQTVKVIRIVVCQVFAIALVEVGGSLAHIDELIVFEILVARPVMVFVDLLVGNGATGVRRNAERIINFLDQE